MVAPSASPTGFTPIDSPQVAVAGDGKLAAIQEAGRVTILELPSGEPFAEVGVDPDAIASAIGWVGTPGRLIVLSRYEAHSTVHLLDPHGPRTIAEIRLESPMRLVASVGATALVVGPAGAAVLAATETHLTLYPFPTRTVPLAAGAAATQIMVALPGSIEEWDPRSRTPTRRLRLPRVAAITAVGGSERLVWMTTQQEPARIDVIPLVNRGQPRAHDLPEPIARIAAHPRSDVVACVGAESGLLYVVDLDGRSRTRVIEPDGIDRIEAAALVLGRTASVLVAQAGRPIAVVSLARRDGEAEAARAAAESGEAREPASSASAVEHLPSSLAHAGAPRVGSDDERAPSSLPGASAATTPSSPPAPRPPVRRLSLDGASLGGVAGDDSASVPAAERDDALGPLGEPLVRRPSSFAALLRRSASGAEPSPPSDERAALEPRMPAAPTPRLPSFPSSSSNAALFRRTPPPPVSPPTTDERPRPAEVKPGSASERFSAWRNRVRRSQLDVGSDGATSITDDFASRTHDDAPALTSRDGEAAFTAGDGETAFAGSDGEAAFGDVEAVEADPGRPEVAQDEEAGLAGAAGDDAELEEPGWGQGDAAARGALEESWRDEIVAWSRRALDRRRESSPAAPAIDALIARFELAPALQPVLVALYGAHLCGERGVAPVEVARLLDRQWGEALGRGELARHGLASYAASRVVLSPVVQRMLDELPPATGTLVGEPGTVALLGPCVVVAGDEPLAVIAARCLVRVGGAILAANDDAERAALTFEARVYGAAPMLRTANIDPTSSDPTIAVVSDDEVAERLAVPRL